MVAPDNFKRPGPPTVRPKLPLKAPVKASDPASTLMRLAALRVTSPAQLLSPLTLFKAPLPPPAPPPLRPSGSAPTAAPPLTCSDAPEDTTVPPAVVPSPPALVTRNTPSVTEVVPA